MPTPDCSHAIILAKLVHDVDCLGVELTSVSIAAKYGVSRRAAQRLLVALDQIVPLVVDPSHEGWRYRRFRP